MLFIHISTQIPELLPPTPAVAFDKSAGNSGFPEVEAGSSITVSSSGTCPNGGCDSSNTVFAVRGDTHSHPRSQTPLARARFTIRLQAPPVCGPRRSQHTARCAGRVPCQPSRSLHATMCPFRPQLFCPESSPNDAVFASKTGTNVTWSTGTGSVDIGMVGLAAFTRRRRPTLDGLSSVRPWPVASLWEHVLMRSCVHGMPLLRLSQQGVRVHPQLR